MKRLEWEERRNISVKKRAKQTANGALERAFGELLKIAKYSGRAFGLREKIANLVERLEKRNTSYLGEKKSGADAK